jgi:RimJ/RimL family protein N-acetyltransferase
MDDGGWQFFRKDLRDKVSQLMTYPKDTKMIPLKKDNFWDSLALKISKAQYQFVLDVKSSVAMALMYKTKKAFVQMEDKVIVGLLVLDIDPKKNVYNIDIIIIDEKYQNRGYGKLMVQWAVEYLKDKGAKKLTIGVSRANPSAIKVYKNAGFKPKSISEGGMDLCLDC